MATTPVPVPQQPQPMPSLADRAGALVRARRIVIQRINRIERNLRGAQPQAPEAQGLQQQLTGQTQLLQQIEGMIKQIQEQMRGLAQRQLLTSTPRLG